MCVCVCVCVCVACVLEFCLQKVLSRRSQWEDQWARAQVPGFPRPGRTVRVILEKRH